MGVPDDCNPLNRRVPAEVVSRRHKPEKKLQEEDVPLEMDRAKVLAMKPEHRLKWLSKALQKGQEGKVTTTLYDIIAHTKFGLGATPKVGRNMFKIVLANLTHFSQKQQRFLEGECKLAKDFRYRGSGAEDAETLEASAGAAATASANGPEADEIPALWERLSTLTAAQCEEAIASLDPATKIRLEDFLEARMRAKASAAAPPVPAVKSRSRSASKSSRSRSKKANRPKDADRPDRAHSSSSSSGNSSSSSSSRRRRKRSRSRKAKSKRDKK